MINDTLPNVLRLLAAQTIDGMSLTDVIMGEVIATSPLKIKISDKLVIDEQFLVLSDAVRDYEVDITVNHTTEMRGGGGGYAEFAGHNHDYQGRKKIIVHNGLKNNEKVIMIKASGGQLYWVASRVFAHSEVKGQWG